MKHLARCAQCESEYSPHFGFFESYFWRKKCPKCGATARTCTETIVESVRVGEAVAGKIKSDAYTGKRKLRGWFFFGLDWSVQRGKFVHKLVSADKNSDTYHERITDIESGDVIHECRESLRDHQGRGSAKFDRKNSGSNDSLAR